MPASQPANCPSKIPIFGKKNLLAPRVSQTAVTGFHEDKKKKRNGGGDECKESGEQAGVN